MAQDTPQNPDTDQNPDLTRQKQIEILPLRCTDWDRMGTMQRDCLRFASYLPFATAAQELEAVCGLRLSASTNRTCAQAVSRQMETQWQQ